MVYLSRLLVSERCQQVRSEIAAPLEMHRTLLAAFYDYVGGQDDARILYRIEREPRPHALVQTTYCPDWSKLTIPMDYLAGPPEVKVVTPTFKPGDRFFFRLRANPTLRVGGKRYGLYTFDEQVDWLAKKSVAAGFKIEKLSLRQDECLEVRGAAGRVARFATVQYDGELIVTSPIMFEDVFEHGLGSAKVMGCGLLSLARC